MRHNTEMSSCPAHGTGNDRHFGESGQRETESSWFVVARIVLLVSLLAAPLAFGAVQAWAWGALMLLVASTALLWSIACSCRHELRVHLSPFYGLSLTILLIAGLQWRFRFSADPIATREAIVKGVGYLVIAFLGAALWLTTEGKMWFYLGASVTAYICMISVFAILQFFACPDHIYVSISPPLGAYVFGPYVNHNGYAGLMELLLPFGAAFWWSGSVAGTRRVCVAFACSMGLMSVVLSGSRAGLASVLLEGALFSVITFLNCSMSQRLTLIAKTIVTGLLISAAFTWFVPSSVMVRFERMFHRDASSEMRIRLTADTIRMITDHPLFGVGLGGFEAAYPKYQSFSSDLAIDYAHNDLVQLIAETGIPGIIVLIYVATSLVFAISRVLRSKIIADAQWYGAAASVALVGVMLHAWFDFNLHLPANGAWAAFVWGIASVWTGPELLELCHAIPQST